MSDTKFLNFKGLKVGKDKNQRDTIAISFSQEQAAEIVEQIQANLSNERGVKVSLHYAEEEKPWGPGYNGFVIVNPIQAPGAGFKGKPGGAPGKFVPKAKPATGMSATTRAKAAATLNTEIE